MPARILLNLTEDSRRRVFSSELADDGYDPLAALAALGEVTRFDPKSDRPEEYPRLLAKADVMVSCWGSRPLTPADLDARPRPPQLAPLFVAHSAGSVRGMMGRELLETGRVRLTQGAATMVPAVAQLTVALVVLGLRQAVGRADSLRRGEPFSGPAYEEVTGIPVGLIGLSRVAVAVAPLLAAFGARLLAYDPYWTAERAAELGVELVPDLDDLLARSRVVSLHAPVTAETRGMLSAARIAALVPGTVLVNTARADLLDQDAAFDRAIAGEITYYTDVTTPEPLPAGHRAFGSPNILITPHVAGPTRQTRARMAAHAVEEVARFLRGEPPLAEVTADRYELLA
jgi:phosphoglycerate dehydrogenase-like enzyme